MQALAKIVASDRNCLRPHTPTPALPHQGGGRRQASPIFSLPLVGRAGWGEATALTLPALTHNFPAHAAKPACPNRARPVTKMNLLGETSR
jgi:hypothetical protein